MNKILIINDDNDTMSLLKSWLEKKSYDVKYTSDTKNVPQLISEFKPTLVLVDILQKEAAEEIVNNKDTYNVPVILMTGYTLRGEPVNLAVDEVIEKPFDLRLLEKKIGKLIS